MLSINIKTFVLFSELLVMMASVILYIIVSLVAGGAVGALLMRLSQGRVAREKLRAELDLQAERNRSEELIADVQAGKKEIESLQEEVRIFLSEKSRLEAVDKLKFWKKGKVLPQDYLEDLLRIIQNDGLTGEEIRFINKLTPKNVNHLLERIPEEYLNRVVNKMNKVEEGDETLILAEQFN